MNSVVHTGVKSEGWEKSNTYLPLAGVIAQLDDAVRALRFEVGRLLKDAWDACIRVAHVFFLVETWLAVGLRALLSRLAFKHEGTRGGRPAAGG